MLDMLDSACICALCFITGCGNLIQNYGCASAFADHILYCLLSIYLSIYLWITSLHISIYQGWGNSWVIINRKTLWGTSFIWDFRDNSRDKFYPFFPPFALLKMVRGLGTCLRSAVSTQAAHYEVKKTLLYDLFLCCQLESQTLKMFNLFFLIFVLFNNLVKKSLVSPWFALIIRINSSTFCVRSEAFHHSVYYFRP